MTQRLITAAFVLTAVAVAPLAAAQRPATVWNQTLDRISTGVVSIRVDSTRAFDTDWNQSTQATGFVVDAEKGLILTNRHVVTAGPVVAQAVFLNNEEVDLKPVYRDPVHDFGVFRYDPASLRFIAPHAFELNPGGAVVGREIRVVGNDAGEQISILAGTLAKLDRRAPEYGRGKYNDFNTFYLQAASGTSGGSSGSPVIDVDGRVVALNAGGSNGAQSSFFLPLDRIQRALNLIREGKPVPRGTLQTMFVHRPFDELRRLGLATETERAARDAGTRTGMLTVDQVVPGSPADGVMQSGDILLRVNGKPVTTFVPLADILDARVGDDVNVVFERGGQRQEHALTVTDLHAISPDEFIEVGEAVVHRLSYQQARHFNTPPAGVYVANPGYMFGTAAIPRAAVIIAVDGRPTPDLDAFEAVLNRLGDGDRASVRFYTYDDPRNSSVRVIRMDRRWFNARRCGRDDELGRWPCRALADGPTAEPPKAATVRFPEYDDPRSRALAASLVRVNFDMPYTASGVSERYYHGTGVVVDAERGWVVVDRNTVPVALGDVTLTFGGSVEVPGKVYYVHPLHNLTVLEYDPALLGETPVRAARLKDTPSRTGDTVWVVGLKGDHRIVAQATEIASMDPVQFPLSRTFRFRQTNLETLSLVNPPPDLDGVLADKKGNVVSLWSSFAYQGGQGAAQTNGGVPVSPVLDMLSRLKSGQPVRSLEVEMLPVPMSAARKLGLPNDWAERIERDDPKRRRVLKILRTVAGTPAAAQLTAGDLLLAIDGEPVTSFREAERITQKDEVTVTVWRDKSLKEIRLGTVALDGAGLDRVVLWAGALVQEPHRALAAQRGIEKQGVYVAYFSYGSPATRYGLWPGRRIVEIDGKAVDDLDSFLAAIVEKSDRESVRLKTVTWNDAVEVITLRLDNEYWPASEVRREGGEWQRLQLEGLMAEDLLRGRTIAEGSGSD
ncbi:MAG: trypsin-like peptidase domain-containing protein [Pseudomonadota bacterium]